MSRTYEVSLKSILKDKGEEEILTNLFLEQGFDPDEIISSRVHDQLSLSVYLKDRSNALHIKNMLARLKLSKVDVTFKSLKKSDWQTKWKNDFKPFRLTKRFYVVPQWSKSKFGISEKRCLFLGPGLAFGTGLHPTTRFMAEFIEQSHNQIHDMLDVGTGTGLLSILALKCGVQNVQALDISPDAAKVAQENLRCNGFRNVKVDHKDIKSFKHSGQFDFVAANLITEDLIDHQRKLASLVRPGKYLGVSGISIENYEYFRKGFVQKTFRCVKNQRGQGWSALLFQKRK